MTRNMFRLIADLSLHTLLFWDLAYDVQRCSVLLVAVSNNRTSVGANSCMRGVVKKPDRVVPL